MILHKFVDSPYDTLTLQQSISRVNASDGVLLLENAVYVLQSSSLMETILCTGAKVYVIEDDMLARGISSHHSKISLINYAQFVQLTLEYQQVISW
ncbi:sulfurtransferase complex subunit TusB [Aliiglaciecola sp. LCG003]|uniref:sulfurtransferase complex subunit TusB n=1 Tax=Aliiglaciecola sp. LCG003 TaxID=3053655 RepID=UPI002572EC1B|nr:sulfurtransferase complex subunit TusB [Aliiglaciecola sp. LCG003]WJG11175.1 sulfurtransferase complex subunit TusB [Aliiglaciecola sp. LCG003]